MNVKKKIKKSFAEKSQSVSKGLKGGPFEHTKTFFFRKMFLIFKNIYKKCVLYQLKTFSQKNAGNKKKEIIYCKVFTL